MPDTGLGQVTDLILALALVGLAWGVLMARDLFKAVVLFIAFGLLMSLVWVRLGAPDIALAEAAIGTGLTAAIFLEAVRQINNDALGKETEEPTDRTPHEPDGT